MIPSRRRGTFACLAAMMSLMLPACHHQAPAPVAAPPALPAQQLTVPVLTPLPVSQLESPAADTAREQHVSIDTHGSEADVRFLLDYLSRAGNFTLVYSPDINRKVRLQLHDVPISVALKAVLAAADLKIEGATPNAKPPHTTSVVYYQLPVNVDSLSADAIMKRFGVGRAIAEEIVKSRSERP